VGINNLGGAEMIYPIEPVSKPRQTQRDKWKKRPCVMKYRWFADICRAHKVCVPESGAHITFYLPMPPSWSEKKKIAMDGQPHQGKIDVDNLLKALLDAIYTEDKGVWDIRVTKVWGVRGQIVITE
jgi:Holliday junction resolvase RusA-like endonuclease